MNVVVEQRGEQIISHADRMQVAVEVQVDVFHRNHLRVTATGGATLHAEHGAQRGLTQADRHVLTDVLERVTEAYRGRGFALARRRRAHSRHQDHARVLAHRLFK